MGKVKRETYNSQLLNVANYSSISKLKILYKAFPLLKKWEEKGDTVATIIRLDLEDALGEISADQCDIIYRILICDQKYQDACKGLDISLRTVNVRLYKALKEVRNVLVGGCEDDV